MPAEVEASVAKAATCETITVETTSLDEAAYYSLSGANLPPNALVFQPDPDQPQRLDLGKMVMTFEVPSVWKEAWEERPVYGPLRRYGKIRAEILRRVKKEREIAISRRARRQHAEASNVGTDEKSST